MAAVAALAVAALAAGRIADAHDEHGSGGPAATGDYSLAQSLLDPTPSAAAAFGSSVAATGPFVAVGSPGTGRVIVYDRSTGDVVRTLVSPNSTPGDEFGASIAMTRHSLLVGAPLDDSAGSDAGAAYVFDLAAEEVPAVSLVDPTPEPFDDFGRSVAITTTGGYLIGAPGDDTAAPNAGAVHVFAGPALQLTLTKPPPIGTSAFGRSVLGWLPHTFVVGDPADDETAAASGAVFVFDTDGSLRHKIANPEPAPNAHFGAALASTFVTTYELVVGAPAVDAVDAAGKVHVFDPEDGAFQRTLASPTASLGDWFGFALTGLGGYLLATAPKDDTGATDAGIAYYFDVANPTPVAAFPNPTPETEDRFGTAVASSCNHFVTTAPQDGTAGPAAGAGYLYLPTLPPCPVSGTAEEIGAWGPVTSTPAVATHIALIQDGTALFWRGDAPTTSYVFDPATAEIEQQGSVPSQLFCAGQATLSDYRLIVIGGQTTPGHGIPETHLFDPVSGEWTRVADMHQARWYPTATTLGDGRVLATAGRVAPGVIASIPEIYKPTANVWMQLPGAELAAIRLYPFMFLLPSGKLFQAGDRGSTSQTRTLDLPTQTWVHVDDSRTSFGSAAMYRPGLVLKAGGYAPGTSTAVELADRIDLNAAAPEWIPTGSMAGPRQEHNLVLLPDGTVLAVGGRVASDSALQAVRSSEAWSPDTETWSPRACIAEPRMYHSAAVLLPDARVLLAGGDCYPSYQIYSPPYLFRGARPAITQAAIATTYGSRFDLETPDAAGIASVALLRPGSSTHALDMNQRFVPLSFTVGAGSLRVAAPTNGNEAPPGYYLLFVVDADGVPSHARRIKIYGQGGPSCGDGAFLAVMAVTALVASLELRSRRA